MLLVFNDSKCTDYTVDSARGLKVIRTHLVLASTKKLKRNEPNVSREEFFVSA